MFETSLVESAGLLRTNNPRPAMISLAAQSVAVAAIVAFPLLHPETIARHINLAHALPMLAPPAPVPPPPVRVRVTPTLQPTMSTTAPTLPESTPVIHAAGPVTDTPPTAPLTMAIGGGTSVPLPIGPASSGPAIAVTGGNSTTAGGAHIGNAASRLATISTGVSAGLLLEPIRPQYPSIARIAHVSGTVMVEAIISPTGHIESARATEGPIMLQAAALEAVRAARYRPFLLNGQPTEVNATFSIHFTLSQ